MDLTQLQLDDLLNRLSWSDGERGDVELAQQACALSDQLSDAPQQFHCRLLLLDALRISYEPTLAWETFLWLQDRYDETSGSLPEGHAFGFLWRLKWLPGWLGHDPQVPREDLYDLLDVIEEYYVDDGQGLAPVLQLRHFVEVLLNGPTASDTTFLAWQSAPRTPLSDCSGCEQTQLAEYLMDNGREEEALKVAHDMLAGEIPCSEQPQALIAVVLPAMLSHHQTELAWQEFLRVSRRCRHDHAAHVHFGRILGVLARTGNWELGLENLADQLPLDTSHIQPWDELWWGANVVKLLDVAGQHIDLTSYVDLSGTTHDLEALRTHSRARVAELAAAFDARNDNHWVSQALAKLSTAPSLPRLPDPAHRYRVLEGDFGEGSVTRLVNTQTDDVVVEIPRYSQHPLAPTPDEIGACDLTTIDGVVELASFIEPLYRYSLGGLEELVCQAWAKVADRWRDGVEDAEATQKIAEMYFFYAGRSLYGDQVGVDAARTAVTLFRRIGNIPQAAFAEALLAVMDDVPENITDLAAEVDAHGTLVDKIRIREMAHRLHLVDVFTGRDWLVEASDLVNELLSLPDADDRFDSMQWRRTACNILLRRPVDSGEEIREDAERVLALAHDGDDAYCAMMAHTMLASTALEVGDVDAAREHLTKAEDLAIKAGGFLNWLGIHQSWFMVRHRNEDTETAEDILWQCYTGAAASADDRAWGASTRAKLAEYLAFQSRNAEALSLAEEALKILPRATSTWAAHLYNVVRIPELEMDLREFAGELCESAGERGSALKHAERVLELAQERGPAPRITFAQSRVAALLTEADPLRASALYREALAGAEQQGLHRLALAIRRDSSYASYEADGALAAETGLEEALVANARMREQVLVDDSAAEQLEDWDFDAEELQLHEMRVRLRAAAENYAGALSLIREQNLVERMWADGHPEMALQTTLNEGRYSLLVPTVEDAEALQIIAKAADRAMELGVKEIVQNAAWVLSAYAREHGDPAEADQILERYGLT